MSELLPGDVVAHLVDVSGVTPVRFRLAPDGRGYRNVDEIEIHDPDQGAVLDLGGVSAVFGRNGDELTVQYRTRWLL